MKKIMILGLAALFASSTLAAAPRGASGKKKAAKKIVREEAAAAREESPRPREARSGAGPKNLITLSPEIFANGGSVNGATYTDGGVRMTVGYEFAIFESNSILARVPVELSGGANGPVSNAVAAFGIGGGYRWYFTGGELSGLYANPLVMIQSSNLTDTFAGRTYVSSALLVRVGGEAGYQTRVWESLYVGANLELGYVMGTYSVAVAGTQARTVGNLALGTSACVGWAF